MKHYDKLEEPFVSVKKSHFPWPTAFCSMHENVFLFKAKNNSGQKRNHYYCQYAQPNDKLPSGKRAFLRGKREKREGCKCICRPNSD